MSLEAGVVSSPLIDVRGEEPACSQAPDLGQLPADWERRPLKQAVILARGQVDPRDKRYRHMILVAPDHIESGTGRLLEQVSAAHQGAISGKFLFSPGDVIYSKIRPYLKKVFLTDFHGLCSADMYPLTPVRDVSPEFLLAVLLGHEFSKFAEGVSARSGIPKINREELAEFTITLPPFSEQQAIGKALSDTDSLIAALNALIAKKRAIKLATMQQLLTGRTRLPGFEEEWETKGFGDLFVFLSTANNPRADLTANASVGYIHYGDIHTATRTMLDCNAVSLPMIAASKVTNVSRIRDGDLIMVDASEDEEGIGKSIEICGVGDRQIVAGLHTFLLRGDRSQIADGFKQYLQFFPAYRAAMTRLATGISVFGISKGNVAGVSVVLPSVPEQQAIAAVLSDMDAEIEALEARIAKTRDIKQGMMQQLLTGRIRLVSPVPEEVPA
jgi:type I restriction enzyme S subunit